MPVDPKHVKVLDAEEILNEGSAESWLERVYLLRVAQGLGVTIRNFVLNLARPSRLPTIQYPEERRDYGYRFRGRHYLKKRPSGEPRCVACMMCATACPADCIYIVAGEHPTRRSRSIRSASTSTGSGASCVATASTPVPRTRSP